MAAKALPAGSPGLTPTPTPRCRAPCCVACAGSSMLIIARHPPSNPPLPPPSSISDNTSPSRRTRRLLNPSSPSGIKKRPDHSANATAVRFSRGESVLVRFAAVDTSCAGERGATILVGHGFSVSDSTHHRWDRWRKNTVDKVPGRSGGRLGSDRRESVSSRRTKISLGGPTTAVGIAFATLFTRRVDNFFVPFYVMVRPGGLFCLLRPGGGEGGRGGGEEAAFGAATRTARVKWDPSNE